MREQFFIQLHSLMAENKDVFFITGDLGYGLADKIREDFPERFINPGAAEVAMMGIGVGLALQGKIPFVYSITPFLLFRPFEIIRNYINHERIPVIMVGSGRGTDYEHDGFSHWAGDDFLIESFLNIDKCFDCETFDLKQIIDLKKPYYLNLKR